jgi:hypothetical protein
LRRITPFSEIFNISKEDFMSAGVTGNGADVKSFFYLQEFL